MHTGRQTARGKEQEEMLIGKDEGHVELSVSLARTWSVSAGVVWGGLQEGSWSCQLWSCLLSVYLSICGHEALRQKSLCLFS